VLYWKQVSQNRYHGRVALLTGAGSGIGRAVAERIAQLGARVIVTDVDAERATAVAEAIQRQRGHAVARRLDVCDAQAFGDLVDWVCAKHGLMGLATTLRAEARRYQVGVSIALPGYIRTAIFDEAVYRGFDRSSVLAAQGNMRGISFEECAEKLLRGVEKRWT